MYRRSDRLKYFAMELSAVTLLVLREVIYIYIMHNLRASGFDDV